MRRLTLRAIAPAVASIALAALGPAFAGQDGVEKFTGFAINMNAGPKTAVVDFTIERWSTDAERNGLLAIIKEFKDPTDKLLHALQELPRVGRIRTSTSLGWDLRYARQSPLDEGGRRIVLATDRPIGFAEARVHGRTMDYPFTIIEMHLDATGKGQGKILAGTKIYIDKNNNLVLENYGQQPVRFNEIHPVK